MNGEEILEQVGNDERARSRYFLRHNGGPWREVTEDEFINAERSAGFFPKSGWTLATGGFRLNMGEVEGKIEYVK